MLRQIDNSIEPEVIGVSNGVCQLEIDFNSLEMLRPVVIDCRVQDFIINQNKIYGLNFGGIKGRLMPKAKLTDIMIFSPYMFGFKYVVSEKFITCLRELEVSEMEYNLFSITLEGVTENYYLLFIPWVASEEVDFSKSMAYPDDEAQEEKKTYFKLKSYDEYDELMDTNPFISFDKICLPETYKKNDLLGVQAEVKLFFSNRLIKKLTDSSISGLVIPEKQVELCFNKS